MKTCEICGEKAEGICPRCYRYVCKNCTDPITLECIDCYSTKRVLEEDYIRYVDSIEKKLEFMESKISECKDCPIYKDAVLSCLRKVKELESLAKLESFERLSDKVVRMKDRAQKIAINFLVRFKMDSM